MLRSDSLYIHIYIYYGIYNLILVSIIIKWRTVAKLNFRVIYNRKTVYLYITIISLYVRRFWSPKPGGPDVCPVHPFLFAFCARPDTRLLAPRIDTERKPNRFSTGNQLNRVGHVEKRVASPWVVEETLVFRSSRFSNCVFTSRRR